MAENPTTVRSERVFLRLAGYYHIKEAQRDAVRMWAYWQNGYKDGKHTEFSVDDDALVKIEPSRGLMFLHSCWRFLCGKWDEDSMDFVTGLPTTQKRHDDLGVVDCERSEVYSLLGKDYRKLGELVLSSGERLIEGPELIEITNEKVAVAKEKLKEARSR
ncbi:hypothetical protein Tco_0236972 [Tanacetum coccineum]